MGVQVHRFHERVACYVGTGATVYMTPAEARKFAKALNAAARDIKARDFLDSTVGTVHFQLEDST